MRVLYVNHTSEISGAEHALLSLLRGLPDDITPAVACSQGPLADAVRELRMPVFPVSGTSGSLKLHPIHTPRAVAEIAASAVVVRSLAGRFGADLLHANSIRAGVIGVLARRLGGPPVLIHLHDRLPRGLLSTASLRAVAGADGVLACSGYVLMSLPVWPTSQQAFVVHNPVDTERFNPQHLGRAAARARLGLQPQDIALTMVAQITPWKGQDDAVRMLARLKERDRSVKLLLVGSPKFVKRGTRYDNLAFAGALERLIASLGLEEDVLRLGERDDIPLILRASDLFLAPSWQEPFSLAVLEAMAMGLPVIATAEGGMGEIIDGQNGILLSPQDPGRWAAEIDRLIEHRDRREEMGRRARASVRTRLDAPLWVDRVVEAYETTTRSAAVAPTTAIPRRRLPVARPSTKAAAADRPVRVLYVNHTSQVSGAERSLLTLLTALDGSVSAVVACPEGRLSAEVRALGLPTVSIHGTRGSLKLHRTQTPLALWSLARAAREINRAARSLDVDVVHANSIRAGLSVGLASGLTGRPAVVHVRDRLPPGLLSSLTYRVLARTARCIIPISRYTAEPLQAVNSGSSLQIVHNCVDLSRFEPDLLSREEARRRLGLGLSEPVLGVVAQITPWKAQDDAIRIAAELRRDHPDVRLLIVGSAKFVSKATRFDNMRYLRELEHLARSLGLEDNVAFLGERDDIPEILRCLDVVLVPSWEEPFGRTVIEAMAMEVPVVATRVGGPTEILTDWEDGVLLPPSQPELWARAVERLLDDPEMRAEMGRRARDRAARDFSLDRHIKAVQRIYGDMLGGVRAG
jgi:L-malate glycosyltransferase